MANFELKMPKLGESITEATITKWLKQPGDNIELDDPILEIATDKVDSEIPSPVEGVLKEQLFKEGETAEVDKVIAIIETEPEDGEKSDEPAEAEEKDEDEPSAAKEKVEGKEEEKEEEKDEEKDKEDKEARSAKVEEKDSRKGEGDRFYSPLVRSIAKEENISTKELDSIAGSGKSGRLTKDDLLAYIENRGKKAEPKTGEKPAPDKPKAAKVHVGEKDEVIEMDRMRKLIADHMVMSEDTSVHITLFREVDMEKVVRWRNMVKKDFLEKEGEKLTFTHIFVEAIARALRDYPMVNVSLDGHSIIKRKDINVGVATALEDGNLIVPVVKNADQKNLIGIAKEVNDLAGRARSNKLKPGEIQGGTFSLTNFGTFGATMGTPIINQPQVGILGVGLIQKKPVVIESADGDTIGIRHRMDLSLSCDHRIVDGALGGMFLDRIAKYLEEFDTGREI